MELTTRELILDKSRPSGQHLDLFKCRPFFSVKSIELGSFLQDPKAKKEKGKGAKNYRSMKKEKNYV